MKTILTGATGFIGAEILQQCLTNPAITSLMVISRRPLPSTIPNASNPKLKVVILDDFRVWPDSVLAQLKGADSCIWALGAAKSPTLAENRLINLDYTIAGASALATSLAPAAKGSGFQFVYCSGFVSERDQNRSLWFLGDLRRMRGDVENQLVALGEKQPSFHPTIARPGGVLKKDGGIMNSIWGLGPTVRVDELAAVMIETAVRGSKDQIIENDALRRDGRELLKGAK